MLSVKGYDPINVPIYQLNSFELLLANDIRTLSVINFEHLYNDMKVHLQKSISYKSSNPILALSVSPSLPLSFDTFGSE